jgi:hypothetical protein
MSVVECVFVSVAETPGQVAGWLAMDAYGIEIQLRGGRTDDVLHTEVGQMFDKLVAARSDLPMLLVHNLDTLVAAYVPGVGSHAFDPLISPDAPDIDTWRPWVVT